MGMVIPLIGLALGAGGLAASAASMAKQPKVETPEAPPPEFKKEQASTTPTTRRLLGREANVFTSGSGLRSSGGGKTLLG